MTTTILPRICRGKTCLGIVVVIIVCACSPSEGKREVALYETFFFPFHGATRVIASDFDQDGDADFSLVSTFPDYEAHPILSFAYLENRNPESYDFEAHTIDRPETGHWFRMDSGDIDKDRDEDIVLSSLTYYFTPVPSTLKEAWDRSFTDILILENIFNNRDE